MSASQLLRILQTLPAGSDAEICAFNADEQEASIGISSRYTNPFLSSDDKDSDNFWNNPQLESLIFANEVCTNHENETFNKSNATCNVPTSMFDKTTGFYIDKHSVECELPELIVCYQESDFHVKNICIDEVIPNKEAMSIHKNNHEFLFNSVPSNGDDDDMIEASCDTEFLEHEWLIRPSTMTDNYMNVELNSSARNATNNQDPENLTNTGEEKLNFSNNILDDVFTDQLPCNSMLSLQQDWSVDFPLSSNTYADDVNQNPLEGSDEELSERDVLGSEAENPRRNGQTTEILNEIKTAESLTFHFNTGKSETTSNDACGDMNLESIYELPLDKESTDNHQDVASSKSDVVNHEIKYVGESSFSMAGVISELISCSRPMPIAGGISTRSNSSATSTRSFAFPTLETEYISSPERMGKAERRRLQKQRGWRKGLLCCKF